MFETLKPQTNFISSNYLIKKAMLKRRQMARAAILKIQNKAEKIRIVK